jgi:hypothetical protein
MGFMVSYRPTWGIFFFRNGITLAPFARSAEASASRCTIGKLGAPAYAHPRSSRHHGGARSLWTELFFKQESVNLAPNLKVL